MMFKKLLSFLFAERCPQCKSKKVVKTSIRQNFIKGQDQYNYYCCKCGFNFCKYR